MRYAISWIAVWLSIATAFGQGHAIPFPSPLIPPQAETLKPNQLCRLKPTG